MAGSWEFNKADPSSVRIGVTQRDQFNNDDVGLAEALVREVIQNSSDAGSEDAPVEVSFRLKTLNSDEADQLAAQFHGLLPHLNACGLEMPGAEDFPVRVLVVEDYNTRGLTGSFEDTDKDNFDSFWRAIGESKKSGQKGGRWGLGKLVFPSSSKTSTFFGLTVRKGDRNPSIMGQAVLKNHSIDNIHYVAHGFWFDGRSTNGLGLQLPVQDGEGVTQFKTLFGVERTDRTGLSVVIPYLIDSITEDIILAGVVNNYYFPILAKRLEVKVGDVLVNTTSFMDIAASVRKTSASVPFTFVKEISNALGSREVGVASATIGDTRLNSDHLSPEQIDAMKAAFSGGRLVHLRVPVRLKPKGRVKRTGHIDLFIRALAEKEDPFSLFARGPITLPGERRHFAGVVARGAMVAYDDIVAEFLGDAENPAHTVWNSNAEKLNANWDHPKKTLSAVRQSLRDLYNLIADQKETQDDDALIDFFSLADKAQVSKGKKKLVKKPRINIDPRETAIRIKPGNGSFEILPGPGAQKWIFPKRIRVRVAYDMIGANPFKQFSAFDFDLNSTEELIEKTNGAIEVDKANVLFFEVTDADFHLKVSGFDIRRDLIVDARAS